MGRFLAFYTVMMSCRKALTERGRPRPRERLPKERSSEGWMKRSGTLAEPSDNYQAAFFYVFPTKENYQTDNVLHGFQPPFYIGHLLACLFLSCFLQI